MLYCITIFSVMQKNSSHNHRQNYNISVNRRCEGTISDSSSDTKLIITQLNTCIFQSNSKQECIPVGCVLTAH